MSGVRKIDGPDPQRVTLDRDRTECVTPPPPHRSSPSPIFCLCSAALTPLAIRDRAAPGLTDHEKYLFDIHGVSTRAIPTVP